jgi:hypothetical protein
VPVTKKADRGRTIDRDIDIDIQGFYRYGSTIGYTYLGLGSFRQYINRRWLGRASESEIFGHCLHELMHRAYDFVHRKSHTGTVPYSIGRFAREAYQELLEGETALSLSKKNFTLESNKIWNIRFA